MTRSRSNSIRWKILASIILPVSALLITLTGANASLLLSESANSIDAHLAREGLELDLLAKQATNPETGSFIDDPQQLLELYITRTIPDPNETMFVISEGSVFARTTDSPPARLDLDQDFLEQISQLQAVTFGDWVTEAGNARYLVVPVVSEESNGALVAVIFSDIEARPIVNLLIRFLVIALVAMIGIIGVGYWATGVVVRPIERLTKFAQRVGEESLQERLPVNGDNSELDDLAGEFNRMLQRLEEAFRSQREFIDVAGHELRTPLTIIRGHFDLVRSRPNDSAASMEIIEDELHRMSRLVQDLQTLTRSTSPQFIVRQDVDLASLTRDLNSKTKSLSKRKVFMGGATGTWSLDPQRISQAVLQLVENALKYSGEGSKIIVKFEVTDSWLQISVEDAGPGIPIEIRERIFEPFVRGRGQQNVEGAGIGLSLVRAIAQAHGGRVDLRESELGGAKFVMDIPRQ